MRATRTTARSDSARRRSRRCAAESDAALDAISTDFAAARRRVVDRCTCRKNRARCANAFSRRSRTVEARYRSARAARAARVRRICALFGEKLGRPADFRVNDAFGRQRLGPQARHFPAHAHARLSAFRADASWRVRSSTSSGNNPDARCSIWTGVSGSTGALRVPCVEGRRREARKASRLMAGVSVTHARARTRAIAAADPAWTATCRQRVARASTSGRASTTSRRVPRHVRLTSQASFPAAAQRSVQASGACQPRGDTPKTFAV